MAFHNFLVTGANGMLGQDLVTYLKGKGYSVTGLSHQELDLLKPLDELKRTIARYEPEIIIHSAAYTNVDGAERDPELAMTINKDGSRKIAVIARDLGCILGYVSTDFVFDGAQNIPYTPEDRPNPVNAYGLSKYYGELMVKELLDSYYIMRTSWLYGVHRHNFVQYILEGARQGNPLTIVNDWRGSPTWTGSLSHMIEQLVTSGAFGTYHMVDEGAESKYTQALAICESAGLSTNHITPASYKDFSFSARRPIYSVLDSGTLATPHWKTSLQAYLQQYFQQVSR